MAGVVHAEAIASTTYLSGVTGARETAIGGCGFCATIDDKIAAPALLVPLQTSVVVVATVTKFNATFHGHVRCAGISGTRESPALNIIPADK